MRLLCIVLLSVTVSGCALAPSSLDRLETAADSVAAASLDYLCNRIRARNLREMFATSLPRLQAWSMLCDSSGIAAAFVPLEAPKGTQ